MNLRQTLFLLLALAQFVSSRFHELTGLGRTVGAMAKDAPSPATPAGYAFLIWILIFILWTICAVQQARPSQQNNPLWQRLGWPMVTALAAGNAWMLTAILHGNGLALLALILVMAAATFTALGRALAMLAKTPPTSFTTYILLPALGLCAGWLTLASFLNLAGVAQLTLSIPMDTTLGAMATITAATLAGGYVLAALRRQPVAAVSYAAALLWGLLATALANASQYLSSVGYVRLPVAVTALLCAAGVWVILACQQRVHPVA